MHNHGKIRGIVFCIENLAAETETKRTENGIYGHLLRGQKLTLPQTESWLRGQNRMLPETDIWLRDEKLSLPKTDIWLREQNLSLPKTDI